MDDKYKKLLLSLLFDGIGMLSMFIPFLGPFSDVVWAPLAAWIMTRMYKGSVGQAAGVFTMVEELVPGMDVIPTFTIMWAYTYLIAGKKAENILDPKS